MKLLSKELVSFDYRQQIQRDLSRAKICRFLVAYVSGDGVRSIGRHLLTPALRDEQSFGVASLSCSCGFDPLIDLQKELPHFRLKYFMDPIVREKGEASDITLFHSKLVYLYSEREAKSVVYIGSHNWTRRALGPQGPRNAEASIRFEFDFEPAHLAGEGNSVASEVNRHLLDAWQMPLCLPATAQYEGTFREWFEKGCRAAKGAPLQDNTVILAVRRNAPAMDDCLSLVGRGIYLQALNEEDGDRVWKSTDRLLVLVWASETALANAQQPVILQCRVTTSKAGIDSKRRGTNESPAPIAGFEAVIWDEVALASRRTGGWNTRPPIRLWSGRDVEVYDFELPTHPQDSSTVDGSVRPMYQFHLEVQRVILPVSSRSSPKSDFVWSPDSFSVAESRDEARVEESPGYFVEPKQESEMLTCLERVLLVQPNDAKVLPYSHGDQLKVGKRISKHPLHETFLGPEWQQKQLRDEYYEKTKPGALVADLDAHNFPSGRDQSDEPLRRLQRVFTAPLDELVECWAETAKAIRGN